MTISGNTTLTDLRLGSHNVTVYVMDLAGNVGASETITFTVAASPALIAIAIIIAVAVAAGLIVYLKKRKQQGVHRRTG